MKVLQRQLELGSFQEINSISKDFIFRRDFHFIDSFCVKALLWKSVTKATFFCSKKWIYFRVEKSFHFIDPFCICISFKIEKYYKAKCFIMTSGGQVAKCWNCVILIKIIIFYLPNSQITSYSLFYDKKWFLAKKTRKQRTGSSVHGEMVSYDLKIVLDLKWTLSTCIFN